MTFFPVQDGPGIDTESLSDFFLRKPQFEPLFLDMFSLVLGYGLDPGEGPGLIFVTLPVAFGQMPAGTAVGSLFFVLLTFAALSSSIGMLEPVVSWLEEHRGFKRPLMAGPAGLTAWLVGLSIVFSFNLWRDFRPLGMFQFFSEKTIFDVMDFFVANIMLLLVHGTPKILLLSLNFDKDLVYEKSIAETSMSTPQSAGVIGAELVAPQPNGFMTDYDAGHARSSH